MLSILIPIYNETVVDLITSLKEQCSSLQIPFEIICVDDCSSIEIQQFNKKGLARLDIPYFILKENIGRSRIRNKLIGLSQYEYLLFIDADHIIQSSNYISTYLLQSSDTSWSVLCGGTLYPPESPELSRLIHWQYGRNREAISAKRRNHNPAAHLHTNNLFIRKDHIKGLQFDEDIIGYGYEDLVFGQNIKDQQKTIRHIDNPLVHMGVKSNDRFLRDLKTASHNLATLYTSGKIKGLKIIKASVRLRKLHLLSIVLQSLNYFQNFIISLLKKHPDKMILVDALRLLYFAKDAQFHHKS